MKQKLFSLALPMTIAASLALFCGCTKGTDSKIADATKNVKVIKVTPSSIEVSNTFAGEIKASDETGVIPKMPGKVSNIFVKVSDTVKEGDILFSLDSKDIEAQLAQAKAGVETQRINLEKAKASNYPQMLLARQNELKQAEITLNSAKDDYERSKNSYNDVTTSKEEFDKYKTSYDRAKQAYDSAKENLKIFETTSANQDIEMAQTLYNQAVAGVNLILVQLENATVRSPISGVVTQKNINVGEGVSTNSPAIMISNVSELKVLMNIPEALIPSFSKGQTLDCLVESLGNKVFRGIVDIIHPSIDLATKNYKVEIRLLSDSTEIKPGMFAKIKMVVEKKNNILTVPNQTILTENGIHYLFVEKENKVSKTPVKPGLSNDSVTEILTGIKIGETVVSEGQNLLSDGETVNVAK